MAWIAVLALALVAVLFVAGLVGLAAAWPVVVRRIRPHD